MKIEVKNISKELMRVKEQVNMRDNLILEFSKKVSQLNEKQVEQQKDYENVRLERNAYNKNLKICKDEIQEVSLKMQNLGEYLV